MVAITQYYEKKWKKKVFLNELLIVGSDKGSILILNNNVKVRGPRQPASVKY